VDECDRKPPRGDLGPLGLLSQEEMKKLKWGTFQQVKRIFVTKPEKCDEIEKGTELYGYVYSVIRRHLFRLLILKVINLNHIQFLRF
jgi:hypothetical protein